MTQEKPWMHLPGVPPLDGPFAHAFIEAIEDDWVRSIAEQLARDGFAVFDFPDDDINDRASRITDALGPTFDLADWRARNGKRSLRVQDAWQTDDDVRAIATNSSVLDLLRQLYGREPRPFQTLNFPVGSQQAAHADAVHFDSWPHGFMCGVWVALEDVDAENGPLVYYPGSHRWPLFEPVHLGLPADLSGKRGQTVYEPIWQGLVERDGLQPQRFKARRGQALIWAANLLHGGDVHTNLERTRWSQVTHYFFDGCAYLTPMHSCLASGEIAFRDQLIDIVTGEVMPNTVSGDRLDESFVRTCQGHATTDLPAAFDPKAYLAANPDVAEAGVNPCEHFLLHGRFENRPLTPDN